MMELTLEKAEELMMKNDGDLYLRHSSIKALPDNLTVGFFIM